MKYVLDASAVIAYFRGEPGADRVELILSRPSSRISIHSINILEIYYKMASYGGASTATEVITDLMAFPIRVYENVDTRLRFRAGQFKVRYPFLSLGDSICIALGAQTHSTVVTSDRPFLNVEGVVLELIR